MQAQGRHTFNVHGQPFVIQDNFTITKELGQGAYGLVVSARNTAGDGSETVAIKKVTNVFSKKILAKRALREVKLLQHFRDHKNITCLYDMDIVDPRDYNELYLYEELMEADLHAIIRSGQPLTDSSRATSSSTPTASSRSATLASPAATPTSRRRMPGS